MSTLRLAAPVLGLLLLAALSALASPRGNVLDGADSQELLIVQSPVRQADEMPGKTGLQDRRLALADRTPSRLDSLIVPIAGENIPEVGQ